MSVQPGTTGVIIVVGLALMFAGLVQYVRQWQVEASVGQPKDGTGIVLAVTREPPQTPPQSTPASLAVQSATATAAPVYEATPIRSAQQPAPLSRIVIPAIEVDSKVVSMGWEVVKDNGQDSSEWILPSFAVGWAENSALPGQRGNIVMAGHNNIEGEVFRDLSDVKPDDIVTLYSGNVAYVYVVEEKYIVREVGMSSAVRLKNAQYMDPTPDERVTLISCWPNWTNTHRVIVVARPAASGSSKP